jgi:uncharacterized protein
MPGFKKSKFVFTLPLNNSDSAEERLSAIFHSLTRSFIILSEKGWASLESEPQPDGSVVEMLTKQGFLVKDGVDEMAVFWNWRQQYVHDFSVLKSKNLVTRQCNNGCRYCIVDAEAKSMSSETAGLVDSFYLNMIKEKNPRKIEDLYSGGEVMLNSDVLLESATRRFYFCMGKGIDYGFTVISNGTLLNPGIVSRMKAVGLTGIRVSIAGPAEVHDQLRPSRDGGKTYERIVENLKSISGMAPIGIETQYDSTSLDYLRIPEMMDDLIGRGIEVGKISFTPIIAKRGETVYTGGMGDSKVYLHLMKEAEQRGFPQSVEAPSNACMSDFRAQIVFDTDGSIIPCGSLQGGEMAYGSAASGIDFVAESQLLQRRFPEKCLNECEILPICMGGCRLQSLGRGGDFNGVDCQYEVLELVLREHVLGKAAQALAGTGVKIGKSEVG